MRQLQAECQSAGGALPPRRNILARTSQGGAVMLRHD